MLKGKLAAASKKKLTMSFFVAILPRANPGFKKGRGGEKVNSYTVADQTIRCHGLFQWRMYMALRLRNCTNLLTPPIFLRKRARPTAEETCQCFF